METAVGIALLSAIGFTIASLVAVRQTPMPAIVRSSAVSVAAGILIALAFGDLFPEGVALAGDRAIVGFVGGFALLFLTEAFSHGHTHHAPGDSVHHHSLTPFLMGIAIHNVADGFALGVSAELSKGAAGALGVGVMIHQVPVGLSLAAVLAASGATRRHVMISAALLGSAIPLTTGVTMALPGSSDTTTGVLTSFAGGFLVYVATTHLLPEAQAEHNRRASAVIFATTVLLVTFALFSLLEAT